MAASSLLASVRSSVNAFVFFPEVVSPVLPFSSLLVSAIIFCASVTPLITFINEVIPFRAATLVTLQNFFQFGMPTTCVVLTVPLALVAFTALADGATQGGPELNKRNTPEYKLIYFDAQMRAEPARMLFKLAGVPFEDVRISKQEWPQLKPTTPFGQLPVLEFDGHKLGQSFAINRFLARKFGFAGSDPLQQAYVDSIADGFKDFFEATKKTVLKVGAGEIQDKEEAYNETISPAREKFLPALRKFLKVSNSDYVVGNSITWADLLISNYFATCQAMFPQFLDEYSDIDNYVKHILDLPKIKKWIAERPKSDL